MQLNRSVTAVVTGGASGLGEATARELAAAGVRVAIFDRDKAKGEKVAADIDGIYCEVDVTSEQSVVDGFQKARAALGQERILVNCAGTGLAIKTASRKKDSPEIAPHPIEHFDRLIQINLIGTFRCIAKSAAGMLSLEPVTEDGERGVLINTGSVAAQDGQIGQAAYAASKGGIVGMTLPIARDLSRDGVRCMTILPGLFNTPLLAAAPEELKKSLGAQVPFPSRLGHPAEYAKLARHICENSMLNGEVIRLDGAIRMAPRRSMSDFDAKAAQLLPGLLGLEFGESKPGYVRGRMVVKPHHMAPNGFLHAASVIALADSACGRGAFISKPEGATGFTTIELKTNFLGTATDGAIEVEAKLIHGGRLTQVWDAEVRREGDSKPLALFRCTQMMLYPK